MIRLKNLLLEMEGKVSDSQATTLFQYYFSQTTCLYFSPLKDQFYSKSKEWYEVLLSLSSPLTVDHFHSVNQSNQYEEEIGRFVAIYGYYIYCLNQTKEKDHWVALSNQLFDLIFLANELVASSCVISFHWSFIS